MATLCPSITWALSGFITGVTLSTLLCSSLIGLIIPAMFVFNWSRHSCQLPPILWSSWGPMTTKEDEEFFFFFFFFEVTLGITCRLKWVVAALRGLWPCGMSWLMESMLSLVGLLGFPLVFSSFGLLNFKTSLFVFLTLLRYFCFF